MLFSGRKGTWRSIISLSAIGLGKDEAKVYNSR
jgi:hypothetical protein